MIKDLKKAIQDEFIKAGIPLPPKYLIENEIARLNRIKNGPATLIICDSQKLLNDHSAIPDNESLPIKSMMKMTVFDLTLSYRRRNCFKTIFYQKFVMLIQLTS